MMPTPRLLAVVALLWAPSAAAAAGRPGSRDLMSDTWVATDALGRTLPGFEDCSGPDGAKRVGIFYFLWLGSHGRGLHDITKILAADPANPPWGPLHAFHWWGESHLGYYTSDDEFVIRKHAQMLTDAGVDAIFFDVTNAATYDDVYLAICRVYEEIRRTGRATPEIAFLTNSQSARTVRHLYENFYAKGLHEDLSRCEIWGGQHLRERQRAPQVECPDGYDNVPVGLRYDLSQEGRQHALTTRVAGRI